jgi:hypothetical protein
MGIASGAATPTTLNTNDEYKSGLDWIVLNGLNGLELNRIINPSCRTMSYRVVPCMSWTKRNKTKQNWTEIVFN